MTTIAIIVALLIGALFGALANQSMYQGFLRNQGIRHGQRLGQISRTIRLQEWDDNNIAIAEIGPVLAHNESLRKISRSIYEDAVIL